MCIKEIIEEAEDIFKSILNVAEEVKDISKSILNMIEDGLKTKNVKGSISIAFFVAFLLGLFFCCFNLEMSRDAWFYVFSALSQTLAAFIAFGAMVLLYRFGRDKDENKQVKLMDEINGPYSIIITSIVLSIILLTFGQINNPPNYITSHWQIFSFFKHVISFFTIGLGILGMVMLFRFVGKMIWESHTVDDDFEEDLEQYFRTGVVPNRRMSRKET